MKLPNNLMVLTASAALILSSVSPARAGESWSLRNLLGFQTRGHAERTERPEKPQKTEKPEKSEKPEQPQKPERPEKPERPGHR